MATCFLSCCDGNNCGSFRGVDGSKLIPLHDCQDDIDAHLRRYHLSNENLNEYQLILTRAGYFDITNAKSKELLVCPSHRGRLGKYWNSPKTTCQYPQHKGKLQSVKSGRVFNVQLSKDVLDLFHTFLPVGSRKLYRWLN